MTHLPAAPVDLTPVVRGETLERARAQILEPAQTVGSNLRLLGVTEVPLAPIVYDGRAGTWLLTDPLRDPTAQAGGGRIPVPAEQHRELRHLYDAGVRCDLLWLAHELPRRDLEDREIARLVPPSPGRVGRRLEHAISTVVPFAATAIWLAALDPIVLGGVRHPRVNAVAWVELCRWTW